MSLASLPHLGHFIVTFYFAGTRPARVRRLNVMLRLLACGTGGLSLALPQAAMDERPSGFRKSNHRAFSLYYFLPNSNRRVMLGAAGGVVLLLHRCLREGSAGRGG
jgi:hypothetical protein